MGFFDIGPLELLLILAVALIIWGPAKIPDIARTLGKTVRTFKKATFDLTTAMTKEISLEEKEHPAQPKTNNNADKTREPLDVGAAESSTTKTASSNDQELLT